MGDVTDPRRDGPAWLPERLERLRARADEVQAKREAQRSCPHSRDGLELVQIFANGSRHAYRGCVDCGRPVEGGRWLPDVNIDELPVVLDERLSRPPCIRCGAFGTELHHFAPRAIFGKDEAELWPTAWLCTGCHDFWHRMMKGVE